jgi:hypothetical protein
MLVNATGRLGERVTEGGVLEGETPREALEAWERRVNVLSPGPDRVKPESPAVRVDRVRDDPILADLSNPTLRLASGLGINGDTPRSTNIGHRCIRRRKPLMMPKETNRLGSMPRDTILFCSVQSCTVTPGRSFE